MFRRGYPITFWFFVADFYVAPRIYTFISILYIQADFQATSNKNKGLFKGSGFENKGFIVFLKVFMGVMRP